MPLPFPPPPFIHLTKERTFMQDLPTPLDHLSAFVLVFLLGVLSAWLWTLSHPKWRCWQRESHVTTTCAPGA